MLTTLPFLENSPLYMLHEMQHAALSPVRVWADVSRQLLQHPMNPTSHTPYGRQLLAGVILLERLTRRYSKPVFGLDDTVVDGQKVKIKEEVVHEKPFCHLLHFKKIGRKLKKQPKLLLVAPMSGHYATLLRGTVQDLLPYCDIYITDWIDAREVPQRAGDFDLHNYIDYVIDFLKMLGPDIHTMAVCQPSVPVLAAVSILNAAKDPHCPRSMTLIGGPIDTREAPTQVNKLAKDKPIEWFERNVVSRVPVNYPGFMRRVYPGFMQLTGFMTMNLDRHIDAHVQLFNHLVQGDGESTEAHRKFYNEYLAVMDITADFYLQTVREVFQKHSLPKGEFIYRDEVVRPELITETALLTLEGERDDISGVGQTYAAHKLCSNLPKHMKRHHMQKEVGHYGIFNGRKFREHVVPIIVDFINTQDKRS